ncbi:MAG: PD-(D/E)XK nuclease family protein [Nanoarchaeota archaeon]|nr:PD-(D/E)XK nuclease family protein [Nanoarchaeota archaeon]
MKNKNIEQLNDVQSVNERNIDFLLFEELKVNPKFKKWFIGKTTKKKIKKVESILHSPTAKGSQFDLLIIFIAGSGRKHGLIIENKISATAQKNQPQRYCKRGEEGIKQGEWKEYTTSIIAPEEYLKNDQKVKEYNSSLSYEEIKRMFLKNGSKRDKFKGWIIQEAIDQNRRGYTQKTDPKTSEFHMKFYRYVEKNYPELEMTEPLSRASGQTWISFLPKKLKPKITIIYKGDRGFLDMEFKNYGSKFDNLSRKLKPFIKKDRKLFLTGKSASLRTIVPKINPTLKFESQIKGIKKVLRTAKKLLNMGIDLVEEKKI